MDIYYAPKFVKEYKRLPDKIRVLAVKKEVIFRHDPYDPRLKTHQLQGKFSDFWAFSVNYQYRIIFEFLDGYVSFYSIGTHAIYRG